MSKRVSPTERIRAEIDDLFASDRTLSEVLEEVARLSVRLVVQAGAEAEVDAFLQRVHYQRRTDSHPPGSRNGWQPPATIKPTMGPVEIQRPKLRGTDERFASRLLGKEVTRTNALEALVISGWVRGLSNRDIEAALAEVLGPEAALSRSTVSRICQRIKEARSSAHGASIDPPDQVASHMWGGEVLPQGGETARWPFPTVDCCGRPSLPTGQ